jgi:hypothetical protein
MRLHQLIAPSIAVSLLSILTGCHLSRVPSPAVSIAAVALSVGGLLATHLFITRASKYGQSISAAMIR